MRCHALGAWSTLPFDCIPLFPNRHNFPVAISAHFPLARSTRQRAEFRARFCVLPVTAEFQRLMIDHRLLSFLYHGRFFVL
jgi:hypothetical protein